MAERTVAVIPAPTTSILGRRAELTQVTDLLWNPDVRLVSLLGPGGIGKTRLAVEVAWELRRPRAQRVDLHVAPRMAVRRRGYDAGEWGVTCG